jgi:branched-chain amino acid aminotransferase
MIIYINGRFLPEEQAVISIHDRGFLYGDGLFEAVRVYEGEPFLWNDHLARFQSGCGILGLNCPHTGDEMLRILRETLQCNRLKESIVRITLSRGAGPRGYSPKGADHPTFLIVPFPPPALSPTYRVIISTVRLLADDPISGFKHLNKLHQVLARAEADRKGANEALLLNSRGFAVEGTTTNLFWIDDGKVCTPPLRGILAGTTRAHVLRLCAQLDIPTAERNIRPSALMTTDGLFVTSCGAEIAEVSHLDGKRIKRSPLVKQLKRHYRRGDP